MREIKVQSFDVRGNRMIDTVGYVLAHNEVRIWYFRDESLVNESFNPSLLILRQFTGLLDKNGKDIFEGDIIVTTYRDRPYSSKAKTERTKGIVIWDDRGQWLKKSTEKGRGYGCCFPDNNLGEDVEVIGNIHENPELIETYP